MSIYRIESVVENRINDFLAITGGDSDKYRAILKANMASRPELKLFLVLQDDVPLGRFTVERYGLGLLSWRPWFKDSASQSERKAGRCFVAEALREIPRHEELPFVQSMSNDEEDPKKIWRDDLLSAGFQFISRTQEWTICLPSNGQTETPPPGMAFSLRQGIEPEARSCLKAAKAGSLDRWQRFEARFGGVVTDYDAIILCESEGQVVGGCGLLTDEGDTQRVWIKGIGVLPGHRGRGVGGALLREALRECARPGVDVARALIEENNEPSMRMFRAAGFEPKPGYEETLCFEVGSDQSPKSER